MKISALPSAGALTGSEVVPIDQGGVTVQATTGAIAALGGGGGGGGGGSGTVTHVTGPLTAGQVVIGNGANDVTVAGFTLVGSTSQVYSLPATGGTLALAGATGTVTHATGALTAGQPVIGNGGGDTLAAGYSLVGTAGQAYVLPAAGGTLALVGSTGTVTHTVGALVLGQVVLGNGAGDVATAGYALVGTAAQTYSLPAATDTLAGLAAAQTLTNKRINPRVLPLSANSATPTVNSDLYDIVSITGQSVPITALTVTGTPVEGQALFVEMTFTATTYFTMGAQFAAGPSAVPIVSNGTSILISGYIWNAAAGKWLCMFGPVAKGTLPLATNAATYTINTDLYNNVEITGQTAAITGFTFTGTPGYNSSVVLNVTGTAAVALAGGSQIENSTAAFPATTVGTAKLSILLIWNTVTSKWRVMAVA